jgi:hypothetical protein
LPGGAGAVLGGLVVGEGGGSAGGAVLLAGALELVGGVVVGAEVVGGAVVCDDVAGRVEVRLVGPDGRWMLVNEAESTALSSASGRSSGLASIVAAPAVLAPIRSATRTGNADRFLTRRNVTVRQRTTIG